MTIIQLHRILSNRFDEEELRILCLYLGVDYDSLRGEGKAGKARELIAHCERYERTPELVEMGKQQRPDISWPVIPEAVEEAPPVSPILTRQPFEPEMILIPAGEFLMGSDPNKDEYTQDDEQPQHFLYLPDYYLAKTPVTNTQYLVYVRSTGCDPPKHWKRGKIPKGKENHPVAYVTWHDAVTYCKWLTKVTGKPYRLPSEAEWEKGARGSDGRVYPWGNQWDAHRCNNGESGWGDTSPVDAYPQGASPYGLVDMAGNVREWTNSQYKAYPYNPSDGRENLEAGNRIRRVLRGGAFLNIDYYIRCAHRNWYLPGDRLDLIGFRVCVVSRQE